MRAMPSEFVSSSTINDQMIAKQPLLKKTMVLISLLMFSLVVVQGAIAAEVISVTPIEDCFMCSKTPSLTMYWKGSNAKVVLLVLPGGTGQVGLSAEKKDKQQPFYENLKRLTDASLTKGQVDLVLLDSSRPLTANGADLSGRATKEHMVRIEAVVKHYKEKTGLPVWILGQSNGGASLANFIRYMQEKKQSDVISGAIASATRPESNFPPALSIPLLFITHKSDGCRNLDQLLRIYEATKAANSASTEWFVVEGGEAEASKDVCHSGYHMFYKSGEQYAQTIDDFISASVK